MENSLHDTFINTNGVRLHAIQAGPQDGRLVILLHGFPEFWWGWKNQIGPLAEAGYCVLAPDLRGYNLSDKPKGLDAYRLDVVARDVLGIIDGLGRSKATLVGHDWGGVASWVLATLFPQRVEKLAVLNAPYLSAGFRAVLRDPSQVLRSAYIFFFQIPGLPEVMLRNNDWELLVRGMRRSSRPGAFTEEDFERYRQAWWQKDAMTSMLNYYRAIMRRSFELPQQHRFFMPILMLWGVKDVALSRATAELSIAQCEQGELVYFEEASHWLHHEQPESVNERLLRFLV